jgi:thiol:disulfide interchange protein DsbD
VLTAAAGPPVAATVPTDRATDGPVSVRLVSDVADADASRTGRVGVLFEMEPGWHVYWRNPGDSGLPTEVLWNAPDGARVGEPVWPTPEQFDDPAGHVSYGYSDMVLLHSPIELPLDVARDTPVTAEVSWLACKAKCVLGSATVELTLPVRAGDAKTSRQLLDQWTGRVPQELPNAQQPFAITVRQRDDGSPTKVRAQAFLKWHSPPDSDTIEWFPIAPDATEIQSARALTRADLTRIDIELRIDKGSDVPGSIASVLVFGTKPNQTSLVLELPLSS